MADLFAPLDDRPAYRQVADVIEQRIVARSLRVGDALPSETDMARQFGVNRSTIREAVRELETHGLIGRDRGAKRLRVRHPEAQRISFGVSRALALQDVTFRELWEAMMAIEPAAAQYAASRRTPAHLAGLRAASMRFAEAAPTTLEAVHAVTEFFTAVAAASGNQVLVMSQAPINVLMAPTLAALIERVPQARKRIGEAQQKIATSIELRRSEPAREWMEKHIRDFKRGYELA